MPLPFSLKHINLYMLRDGEGWAVLDTGLSTSMVRDIWTEFRANGLSGLPITKIIVTHYHPDHFGLAGWLHQDTGAPLYMSHGEYFAGRMLSLGAQKDVPETVLSFYRAAGFPDIAIEAMKEHGYANFSKVVSPVPESFHRLREGDSLAVGARHWQIVMGNGHSPEHACLYDAEAKILISGDQLLPRITSNISVYPTEPEANPLQDWLDSLAKLMTLPEDCLVLPAHNEPFYGLRQRADQIARGHLRSLQRLSSSCEEPKSAVESFPFLFKRKLEGFDFILAAGEALAHHHFLVNVGVAERTTSGGVNRFRTIAPFDPATVWPTSDDGNKR